MSPSNTEVLSVVGHDQTQQPQHPESMPTNSIITKVPGVAEQAQSRTRRIRTGKRGPRINEGGIVTITYNDGGTSIEGMEVYEKRGTCIKIRNAKDHSNSRILMRQDSQWCDGIGNRLCQVMQSQAAAISPAIQAHEKAIWSIWEETGKRRTHTMLCRDGETIKITIAKARRKIAKV